jgi:hypothetical protein
VSESEAVTCYDCNPCSSADMRSWGKCSGHSCFSRTGSRIANPVRGCSPDTVTVAYCHIEPDGGLISKKRSLSTNMHIQTCYCQSDMCNGPSLDSAAMVSASATSLRQRQQLYYKNLVVGLTAVGYFIAFNGGGRF